MNKFLSLFFLLALLVSCSHSVHLVHVSDYSKGDQITSGTMIKSQAEQFVILGFTLDTTYVEQARTNLITQCEGGEVQGVLTRLSTSHGFLSWTNTAFMQGLCVR